MINLKTRIFCRSKIIRIIMLCEIENKTSLDIQENRIQICDIYNDKFQQVNVQFFDDPDYAVMHYDDLIDSYESSTYWDSFRGILDGKTVG